MKHIKIKILFRNVKIELKLIAIIFFLFWAMRNIYCGDYSYSAANSAMAGAYSAISGDINSLNINPAGITGIEGPEINAGWGKLYGGLVDDSLISQSNLNLALPFKYGLCGFSWNELKLSQAYLESVFNLTIATSIYKNLYNGISFKYFKKSYSKDEYTRYDPLFDNGYSRTVISFDVGSIYKYNQFSFSWVIKNINQPDIGLGSEDKIRMENIFGAAYYLKNSTIDMDISFLQGKRDFLMGISNQINSRFILRGGIDIGNNSKRVINAGLGWNFSNFSLDYSFSLPVSGLENSGGIHKVSFGFKFFKPSSYKESEYKETGKSLELEKELEKALNALKEMQIKYESKQDQINELERRINQQNELIKSIKESSKVEKVYLTTSTADIAQLEKEIEYLNKELENTRKEKKELKEKIEKIEQSIKVKKQEPVIIKKTDQEKGKKLYVVEKGDTLESIARKVYGDGSKWIDIYKANQKNISGKGEVVEGQILIIP